MKKRTKVRMVFAVAAVIVAGSGVMVGVAKLRGTEAALPTAKVQRGDVDLRVFTTGDLRAPKSAMVMAPSVNGTLQIVQLAKTGEIVKKDDMVLQFDPSEQEYNLAQAQSQLREAKEKIVKMNADTAVQNATDQVSLLHAQYDVRRAELDVSLNEIKSTIEAKENDLALEEAHRRLDQLQQDIKSRAASNQAQMAVLQEQQNKALLDIKVAQTHIDSMTIKSPMDGIVTVRDNIDANGFNFGQPTPEYQLGDLTYSGRPILQVMDTSQMEISGKILEVARADLSAGETAEVRIDAMPEQTYTGKVKMISGQASSDMWGGDPAKRFDVTFAIDRTDPRLRPGLSSQIIVQGEKLKNVLFLPRQAIFVRDGKPIVYAKAGRGFESKPINVKHTTESQAVVEGIGEGTEVALVNPEQAVAKSAAAAPAGGPGK
ncbi:MAG TPA: HlyD family efflux transporter periplasmic adaptor subunit [Candidatus Acidoferrales bacterium]|nr:HlyD family efflux transporter periplasmic adaptor subunit [Candidatus Acidoferrales bacterium]